MLIIFLKLVHDIHIKRLNYTHLFHMEHDSVAVSRDCVALGLLVTQKEAYRVEYSSLQSFRRMVSKNLTSPEQFFIFKQNDSSTILYYSNTFSVESACYTGESEVQLAKTRILFIEDVKRILGFLRNSIQTTQN